MKRARPTDEVLLKYTHDEFILWFLEYNKSIINRYIMKRLIPNRYDPSDIKAYMAERMLDILAKRDAKDKSIENPRIYFGKLIDFWCIEYQRMHGYCYGMPKRPRCPEAEQEIAKYGFVYMDSSEPADDSNYYGFSEQAKLAYVDATLTPDTENYELRGYAVKSQDPGELSSSWSALMKMILPEDRPVIECLFVRDMSIPEASKHLGIAVSTAYTRRDRAMLSLSGHLMSSVDLDNKTWKILNDVNTLTKDQGEINSLFNNLE